MTYEEAMKFIKELKAAQGEDCDVFKELSEMLESEYEAECGEDEGEDE